MRGENEKFIYFIIGTSGVGKSTLLENLQEKYRDKNWAFYHFEEIESSDLIEVDKEYNLEQEWLKVMTQAWIDYLINKEDKTKIFIEGTTKITYINEVFEKHNFTNYVIILITISGVEGRRRLQKNLENLPKSEIEYLESFKKLLLNQARKKDTPIIEVSNLNEQETLNKFEEIIDL